MFETSRARFGRAASRLALIAGLAVLGACTTATPYQPLARGSAVAGGFSDQQIEPNRFRVTFAGNSLTSRQTVEDYLLYRAAELTVAQGGQWFTMADRDTERRSQTYINRPFGPGLYGYWGPRWRFRGAGFGWRSWDPFWGDPFFDSSIDVRTVNQYEASAEIVIGQGSKPANDPRAFDAQAVLSTLGPRITRPEDVRR